jgi:hypothetical protein
MAGRAARHESGRSTRRLAFADERSMAPTVVRDGPFRLFFFSREEPRMHIHVAHADGEAKFWLEPNVSLAGHTGLSATVLSAAEDAVVRHLQESKDAWNNHFGR